MPRPEMDDNSFVGETLSGETDLTDEGDGSYDGDILYEKQKNIYVSGENNTIHIHM